MRILALSRLKEDTDVKKFGGNKTGSWSVKNGLSRRDCRKCSGGWTDLERQVAKAAHIGARSRRGRRSSRPDRRGGSANCCAGKWSASISSACEFVSGRTRSPDIRWATSLSSLGTSSIEVRDLVKFHGVYSGPGSLLFFRQTAANSFPSSVPAGPGKTTTLRLLAGFDHAGSAERS